MLASVHELVTANWPWLGLSLIWSLNGPIEQVLMREYSAQSYAKAKAVAVGVAFLASPVEMDVTIFAHPLMWVLFLVRRARHLHSHVAATELSLSRAASSTRR